MSLSGVSLAQINAALEESAIIAVTDPRGRIISCNDHFCRISGYDREDLLGSNHRIVNSGLHDKAFFAEMYATIMAGRTWRNTIRNRRKDGSFYWVDTTIVPQYGEDGRLASFTSVRFDVSNHIQALEDLARARQKAETAVATQNLFIANVSHEIRTPLNGVLGVADALSRTGLDDRQSEMVRLIVASGGALRRILDDILDLSKLRDGRMTIERIPMDIEQTLREVAELMKIKAQSKGLNFELVCAPGTEGAMMGDPLRLRQILLNLIANAVKFTDEGQIAVHATVESEGDGEQLVISVSDTGEGMTQDALAQVFRPFYQADNSIARRYGGTGLGLSICRALSEEMHGRIEINSTPGEGSTFVLRLPMERVQAPVETPAPVQDAELTSQPMHILLAEDHPTNQKVVEMLLSPLGIALDIAQNGQEAVERFKTDAYDAILMDMQMPVMDGLSAIRAIRNIEAEAQRAPTPIAMMTANTSDAHYVQAIAAGADLFIAKPVTFQSLAGGIEKLVSAGHEAQP